MRNQFGGHAMQTSPPRGGDAAEEQGADSGDEPAES